MANSGQLVWNGLYPTSLVLAVWDFTVYLLDPLYLHMLFRTGGHLVSPVYASHNAAPSDQQIGISLNMPTGRLTPVDVNLKGVNMFWFHVHCSQYI